VGPPPPSPCAAARQGRLAGKRLFARASDLMVPDALASRTHCGWVRTQENRWIIVSRSLCLKDWRGRACRTRRHRAAARRRRAVRRLGGLATPAGSLSRKLYLSQALSRKRSLASSLSLARLSLATSAARARRQLLASDMLFVHTAGCIDPSGSNFSLARATHGQGYTAMTQTGISWRDWWPSLAPSTGCVNRWSRIFCNKWRDGATDGLGSRDSWRLRRCTLARATAGAYGVVP
jgi:hypothetical protein